MRKFCLTIILAIACCAASVAAESGAPTVYKVDLDSSKTVCLDSRRLFPLEYSDVARIKAVKNLLTVDGRYIVLSGNEIKAFSMADGRFLGQYECPSMNGWITRLWLEGDTVKAFDNTGQTVYSFDVEGRALPATDFKPKGSAAHPLDMNFFLEMPGYNGYLGFNRFTDGTFPTNPAFSLYDSTLTFVRDIPGREMTSGWVSNNMAWSDKHEVLYWEAVCDTVFAVTTEGVRPEFVLDFGKNKVPGIFQSNPVTQERISAFAGYFKNPARKKASFAVFFQRDSRGRLWFIFQTSDKAWHLARLDEENGGADIFDLSFEDPQYRMMPFLSIAGDEGLVVFKNDSSRSNPGIYKIDLNELTD